MIPPATYRLVWTTAPSASVGRPAPSVRTPTSNRACGPQYTDGMRGVASVAVRGSPKTGSLMVPWESTSSAPLSNPPGANTNEPALRARGAPAEARVTEARPPSPAVKPVIRLPWMNRTPAARTMASSAS